ncbi:MAG: hypothetical protein WKF73_06970 [Nocardioidaceae bacterium]
MTTTTTIDQDTIDTLTAVVRLLHRAADLVCAQAEREGPRSFGHLQGLGVQVTACEALELLPSDARVDGPTLVESDPVELLRAAEQLMHTDPDLGTAPGLGCSGDGDRRPGARGRGP